MTTKVPISAVNYVNVEKVKEPEYKRTTSQKKVNWTESNENLIPSANNKVINNDSIKSALKTSKNHASQTSPSPIENKHESLNGKLENDKNKVLNEVKPNNNNNNNNDIEIEYSSDTIRLHAELKKVTMNLMKSHGIKTSPASTQNVLTTDNNEAAKVNQASFKIDNSLRNGSETFEKNEIADPLSTNLTSRNGLNVLKRLKNVKN